MVTQTEKRTFPTISHQSLMLAKQARLEQQKNGYVSVICPKCQEHREITTEGLDTGFNVIEMSYQFR